MALEQESALNSAAGLSPKRWVSLECSASAFSASFPGKSRSNGVTTIVDKHPQHYSCLQRSVPRLYTVHICTELLCIGTTYIYVLYTDTVFEGESDELLIQLRTPLGALELGRHVLEVLAAPLWSHPLAHSPLAGYGVDHFEQEAQLS